MKYLALFIIFACSFINCFSVEQTHVFKVGTTILFYPVSSSGKSENKGFDCFYDVDKCHKKSSIQITLNPKNRLEAKNGYTPYESIEGHCFTVEKTFDLSVNKRNYYCATLTREDGEKVYFAIPFMTTKKENELTQSMIKKTMSEKEAGKAFFGISIPFITLDDYKKYKNYEGQTIVQCVTNYDKINEWVKVPEYPKYSYLPTMFFSKSSHELYKEATKKKNSNPINDALFRNGYTATCLKMDFVGFVGQMFKQPMISISVDKSVVYLPICDSYGTTSNNQYSSYHGCTLSDFYMPEKQAIEVLVKNNPDTKETPFGSYFNGLNYESLPLSRGFYVFKSFCILSEPKYEFTTGRLGVKLVDSNSKTHIVEYMKFKKCCMPAREAIAEIENWQSLIGKDNTNFFINLNGDDKIKFSKAVLEWNITIAKKIVRGEVELGWTSEMCELSWGEPKKINTSIGIWGKHEQWCYPNNRYLYIENGILKSLQM